MTEIRVAVLGASGWMGKVHTMAYQTFPHFFGTEGGTARVVTLVDRNPARAQELAARVPGARIVQDWREVIADPEVDLVDPAPGRRRWESAVSDVAYCTQFN